MDSRGKNKMENARAKEIAILKFIVLIVYRRLFPFEKPHVEGAEINMD